MKTKITPPADDRRSGVALIITIGLLSLLLLLAFTFAVSMQTERAAAVAATDGMQARQSIMTCLSRAACDINARILGHVIDQNSADPRQVFVPYPQRNTRTFQVRNHETKGTTKSGVWVPYGVYGKNELESGRIDGMYESAEQFIPGPVRDTVWQFSNPPGVFTNSASTGELIQGLGQAWWASTFSLNDQTGFEDYACTQILTVRFMQTEPIAFSLINVNCAGYLDPIALVTPDNAPDRRYGTNVQEIVTSELTGSGKLEAAGLKPGDVPLAETWRDMVAMLEVPSDQHHDVYFYPFSHYPVGEYLKRDWGYNEAAAESKAPWQKIRDSIQPAAFIAGNNFDEWSDDDHLRDAFSDAFHINGKPTDEVLDWLIAGLKDYVDEDYEPRNITDGYPSQEPIGMMNEVILETKYIFDADVVPGPPDTTNYTLTIENRAYIEVWNPYIWDPNDASGNGQLPYRLRGRWQLKEPESGQSQYIEFQNSFNLAPREWYAVPQRSVITFTDVLSDSNFDNIKNATIEFNNVRTQLDADWGAAFRTVDRFKDNSSVEENPVPDPDSLTKPTPGNPTEVTSWLCIEALDPRFNYDLDDEEYFQPRVVEASGDLTISNYNFWTEQYLTEATNLTDGAWDKNDSSMHDHYTYMYTANKSIRTVGELGYIAYAPWKTLRLYRHPAQEDETGAEGAIHRVVDTFTLLPIGSRKGMVNPNTEHLEVLKAVFKDMPVDMHPDQDDGSYTKLGSGNTYHTDVAQAVLDHTSGVATYRDSKNEKNININKYFYEVSDMGMVDQLFDDSIAGLSGMNDFQKESLIRNSCGLFNTRQNLFMSLMAASYVRAHHKFEAGDYSGDWQYYVNLNGPRSSERRGLAVFWTDTWTGNMITRTYKYLNP